MSQIQSLHQQAMDLAKAAIARWRGAMELTGIAYVERLRAIV
jgi:hypothetical protein